MDGRDPVGPDAKEREPEKQPTHPTEPGAGDSRLPGPHQGTPSLGPHRDAHDLVQQAENAHGSATAEATRRTEANPNSNPASASAPACGGADITAAARAPRPCPRRPRGPPHPRPATPPQRAGRTPPRPRGGHLAGTRRSPGRRTANARVRDPKGRRTPPGGFPGPPPHRTPPPTPPRRPPGATPPGPSPELRRLRPSLPGPDTGPLPGLQHVPRGPSGSGVGNERRPRDH